jgi:predicted nuclease with TOPRIM domain
MAFLFVVFHTENFFSEQKHRLISLYIMKDIRSLLLVLLSAGLISTWIYHFYDKTMYSRQSTLVNIKDSFAVAESVRDSLQKIYSLTISNLDIRLDSTKSNVDSLKDQLNTKLSEIYKLRNEIGNILKNRGASKADLNLAGKKIGELQQKVDELHNQNTDMEEEKKRLTGMLEQLNNDMKGLEQNVKRLDEENKTLTEKINMASGFVASEIKFTPVTLKNSKELETSDAKKTNKFIISFNVQNNISENNNAEVIIIVTQPDGQVLQNSVWDAGSFETHNEGRKNYTVKMRFEYQKGEPKHLLFTLDADSYQKGNYTLQIYHNGILIGKAVKTLS